MYMYVYYIYIYIYMHIHMFSRGGPHVGDEAVPADPARRLAGGPEVLVEHEAGPYDYHDYYYY